MEPAALTASPGVTRTSDKILLELCCGSLADATEAQLGGADRIELCSALYLGGLSPSAGTILEAARQLSIPFIVMLRPRPGGFDYSAAEFTVMQREAEFALAHGAAGVVFGILHPDGTVDAARSREIVALAQGRTAVFHRAFDVTPDPLAALEQLIEIGVSRVLTSGQKADSLTGAPLIRAVRERAAGRIEILPGGGIDRHNLADIVRLTGVEQIHLAALRRYRDASCAHNPALRFGAPESPSEDVVEITDREEVAAIVAQLRELAVR